ncbi:MAG: hypothetical protein N2045_07790 [Fimbriimonadales bacterium]|nr:hypothetical protein [Fimbriimonadales bacterium]
MELAKVTSDGVSATVLFHHRKTPMAAAPAAICHHLADRHPTLMTAFWEAIARCARRRTKTASGP